MARDVVPMPYLTIFVLMRDGVPVYASRNPEFVKAKLGQKLVHLGYPLEVIEHLKFVKDDRLYEAKHPYLREIWHVREVDAD